MGIEPDMSATATNPTDRNVAHGRRWLATLFLLVGLVLVPWAAYLLATLPGRHVQTGFYDLAWGGFDVALAAVLLATGVGLLRRRAWVRSTAIAAATLLLCDAWFDILGATDAKERLVAVLLATTVELPTAVACVLIARHVAAVSGRAEEAPARRRPRLHAPATRRRDAESGA